MKIQRALLTSIIVIGTSLLQAAPDGKITFHFVTDEGKPASHIPINASTFSHWQPGEGFGQDVDNIYTNTTDENGLVTFNVSTPRGDIAYGTITGLNGYYPSGGKYQFKTNSGGKWQPWNPAVELIIKRITNPIPMYAKTVGSYPNILKLPAFNTPVGFDLEAGDWVVPYGNGSVSDFIFDLTQKVPFVNPKESYDVTNTLSFTKNGDGIQSVITTNNHGADIRMLCNAPEIGFGSTLVQKLSWNGTNALNGADGVDQNYFYRVRTVLDAKGNIKSTLYGKIRGPILCGPQGVIQFTYYLNPTPNDRNMEFDPKKNLFQNLTDDQQVKAP